MPQHKQYEKDVRKTKKATLRNKMLKSKLRTLISRVLKTKDKKKAQEYLREAVSYIDKCVGKGIIHKNNAANKKSRLYAFVNKLK
jgi:small subunit ribosomal protein S20